MNADLFLYQPAWGSFFKSGTPTKVCWMWQVQITEPTQKGAYSLPRKRHFLSGNLELESPSKVVLVLFPNPLPASMMKSGLTK